MISYWIKLPSEMTNSFLMNKCTSQILTGFAGMIRD